MFVTAGEDASLGTKPFTSIDKSIEEIGLTTGTGQHPLPAQRRLYECSRSLHISFLHGLTGVLTGFGLANFFAPLTLFFDDSLTF